jgi:hypothetical protein
MEYWVIYSETTGNEIMRGASPEAGAAGRQVLEAGQNVMALAENVWRRSPVDLAEVKTAMSARIDEDAEACRARFITPGAGQAMTYLRKEMEARLWHAEAPVSSYPFLAAEAEATGKPIAELVAIVVAAADAWAVTGAAIEAARRKAKLALAAAGNLAEIAAAAAVDWAAID